DTECAAISFARMLSRRTYGKADTLQCDIVRFFGSAISLDLRLQSTSSGNLATRTLASALGLFC
ncbi:MAG: hypothetical protein AAF217_14990, partial [Pseudomonadota bacterium]